MAEPTRPTASKPPDVADEDDSDPDFDDLDDVLDQFSAATTSQQPATVTTTTATKSPHDPTPSLSGPGRPAADTAEPGPSSATALPSDIPIPSGPKPNESEDEFLARLTAEMSTVMSKFSMDPAASAASPEDIAKMGQELEEFTQRMEAEGIQPEDMLKAILGEDTGNKVVGVAEKERDRRESESKSKSRSPEKSRTKDQKAMAESSTSQTKSASKSKPADSFEDTIRKTMARMESSSAAASDATQKSTAAKSEEDMLAEMLRALDSEGGGGGGSGAGGESEGDLSKMFLGMMEQLTNKEMLYEPMKELSTKYPSWLDENRPLKNPKLSQSEHDRFSRQRVIVDEIVAKFEMKGYSDEDPKCREFIWEKMQQMQGEGAPPEELVANPFPGMGMPGLGLGDGAEGLEEGCPTQ